MQSLIRWIVVGIGSLHGLIHVLGVVKGFGWAEVDQLDEPIGTSMGAAWLVATVVVLLASGLLAVDARWWRPAMLAAALVSQLVIFTSWSDARAGTLANLLLVAAVALPAAIDR